MTSKTVLLGIVLALGTLVAPAIADSVGVEAPGLVSAARADYAKVSIDENGSVSACVSPGGGC